MAAYNFERPFSEIYTFTDGETKLAAEMFDNLKAELTDVQNNLWKAVYPVGAIYISTVNTNPGTLFGGTWEAYGRGRTLVSAETEGYKAVGGYTFGSDALQSHSHTIDSHTHTAATAAAGAHSHRNTFHYEQIGVAKGSDYYIRVPNANGDKTNTDGMVTESSVSNHTHAVTVSSKALTTNSYGLGSSNNYQPSIIVFMFRRVA